MNEQEILEQIVELFGKAQCPKCGHDKLYVAEVRTVYVVQDGVVEPIGDCESTYTIHCASYDCDWDTGLLD